MTVPQSWAFIAVAGTAIFTLITVLVLETDVRPNGLQWTQKQRVSGDAVVLSDDHIELLLKGPQHTKGGAPVPAAAPMRAPKIAFMFLTRGSIPLESVWDRFFQVMEPVTRISLTSREWVPPKSRWHRWPWHRGLEFCIESVSNMRTIEEHLIFPNDVSTANFQLSLKAMQTRWAWKFGS
jgi:hypothetical protein